MVSKFMDPNSPGATGRSLVADASWPAYVWYEMLYWLGGAAMNLGFSLRTEGRNNMPDTGPVLVVANHQSFLDPLLVGVSVHRHLCYLARKTLFHNPIFAWLIRSYNAVPIDQEGVGKEGLKTILQELSRGQAVLVFPEGERTETGRMVELRPGIHLLIRRAQVPLLPVGIAGAYHAWPRWRSYPVPSPLFLPAGESTIALSVGKPIDSRRFADMPRQRALQSLSEELAKVQSRAEELRRK